MAGLVEQMTGKMGKALAQAGFAAVVVDSGGAVIAANAGYALGMTYWQVMRQVVLPQAFRNMTPVLLTQTIILFQDVSLVYIISLPDFVTMASKVAQRDGRLVEMYLFVAVVYFAICLFLSFWVKRLQTRIAIAR